jgi:hypothetical protein
MADVFISYSRENQAVVRLLADAVRREGYSLWWDDELPPHRSYGDVITEQIGTAKAAIVVWSQSAAASEWVRAEADVARNQKKLIQASIDGHMPPLPFNQIQFASIGDWKGEPDHPGWRKIRESLAALCGAATNPPAYPMPAAPPPAPRAAPHKWNGVLIGLIVLSVVTILGVAALAWMGERAAVVVNQVAATPETTPDKPETEPPPVAVVRPAPAAAPRPKQVAEAPPRQAMPTRAAVRYCLGRGRGTPECAARRRQVRNR